MDEILYSPWLDYVMLAITLFTVWTGVSYLISNRTLFVRNPAGGR
jgi:CDP-diacylglycerol--glycerol-3-phosphate 3-phosphatidyltransferase